MKFFLVLFSVFIFTIDSYLSFAQSIVPEFGNKKIKVNPVVGISTYGFPPQTVKLSPGSPFSHARSMDSAYLMLISPYRLLTRFYINAGMIPKDSLYGGWENSGLSGHTLGHYLSAASMMYSSTGSIALKHKVDTLIKELSIIQIKRKSGYVGGIPQEDSIFAKVKRGVIKSSGFDLNGGWSPWYTVHKIMAGLCDAYLYTSNKEALKIVTTMADWVDHTVSSLDDSLRLKMLNCEYGGMNDVLSNIYSLTGNKKYLLLSYKFYDDFVMGQLAKGIDPLPGKHSNTNVPKAIGSARQYELTGNISDKKIAETFWNAMVHDHTYAIGGNSNYEYCGNPNALNDRLSDNTCETCNTYNMLKLTRHLFAWKPSSMYMDFYERALYNHILSSQNPATGMMCYFVPLRMGTKKIFSDTFNTFTCCVGSGMENHSKYQEQIYSHDGKKVLYVNLFIPSEVQWKENRMTLHQSGDFLHDNAFDLSLKSNPIKKTTIAIRHPFWSDSIKIWINGIEAKCEEKNGYLYLSHDWKMNDRIHISLNQTLYTEPMPDNADRVAFKYGPLVLAADLGATKPAALDIPVLVTPDRHIDRWIKKIEADEITFQSDAISVLPHPITLRPFYQVYQSYYSVYLDYLTTPEWIQRKTDHAAEIARIKDLDAHTIDFFNPGIHEDEVTHHLTNSERSYTDEALGRWGREARADHFFQFDLKADPNKKNQLVFTYIGDDKNRIWDVLIDEKLLTTVEWQGGKTGIFYDMPVNIPTESINGKNIITIKILANHGKTAGRIFYVRNVIWEKGE